MPLDLIPQVFYDLIARIIPGTVLIIASYLTVLGPKKAIDTLVSVAVTIPPERKILNVWLFALLMILAYVLSMIVHELWSLASKAITSVDKKNQKKEKKSKEKKKEPPKRVCFEQDGKIRKCFEEPALGFESSDLPATHVMHDHLRLYSPSEAYRLLKLRAERNLCEVLFTGFLLLALVNILLWYHEFKWPIPDWTVLELALVLGLVTLWNGRKRFDELYRKGTCTAWLLLNFPVGTHKQTDPAEPSA